LIFFVIRDKKFSCAASKRQARLNRKICACVQLAELKTTWRIKITSSCLVWVLVLFCLSSSARYYSFVINGVISQFLSAFLVIVAYPGISFFDAFKGAFSFRLVCSYCLVAFCLVLVVSLLIVLWAWCRYTQRICLFADLKPISIILIYTLGRAWFHSCFW
jgi:hypothetical protein